MVSVGYRCVCVDLGVWVLCKCGCLCGGVWILCVFVGLWLLCDRVCACVCVHKMAEAHLLTFKPDYRQTSKKAVRDHRNTYAYQAHNV